MFNQYPIIPLSSLGFAVASIFILGFIVFLRNTKSLTGRLFVLFTSSVAVWDIFNFLSFYVIDQNLSIWLIRFVLFFAVLFATFFFLLILNFQSEVWLIKKKNLYMIIFFAILAMISTLSPFTIRSIDYLTGNSSLNVGWGIILFAPVVIFFDLGGLFLVIKRWLNTKDLNKSRQYYLLFIGFLITLLSILLFSFIMPAFFDFTDFVPYSALFTVPLIIFTAYSIIKYKLFDVKVIATEFLTFIIVLISFGQILLSKTILETVFRVIIFVALLIFSILLIKSVLKEIKQKEELTHLTHSLEKANLRLKELDQQKTDFLSIASHQLRTPLSISKGYIELLEDGAYGKIPREAKTILDNMDESNGHLVKLVDGFLDITRIEQGRTKFSFSDLDMNILITRVVKELKDRAQDKGLSLVFKADKKVKNINADEEKIRHVVFNFVDNAIKYSEKGSIKIFLKEHKNGLSVTVVDNGFGFGKEDEVAFFQKFYRGKNVEGTNVSGTGLGLFICRKFIEAHGGHVWAHSQGLGKGSEFGFWIPQGVKSVEEANKKIKKT